MNIPPLHAFGSVAVVALACTTGGGGSIPGPDTVGARGDPLAPAPDPCRGIAIPASQHFVKPGLCARVVARTVDELRGLTFAPNGDLFAVAGSGTITRFRDVDGDGVFAPGAPETVVWAEAGGPNGHNCHIDVGSGYLYSGTIAGVRRWKYAADIDDGGAGEDVMIGQPSVGHEDHVVHVYDGWMYVGSATAGNDDAPMAPEYDTNRSMIKRFDLSKLVAGTPFNWSDGEAFVVGLRNPSGFTRNLAGRMYAVHNGIDEISYDGTDVHEDNPGEQIVLLEKGRRFGAPYCFTAQRVFSGGSVIPAGTQLSNGIVEEAPNPHDDDWCAANSDRPVTFLQAHSAPLDIAFLDGPGPSALPARWRGGAFVSLHGSWNRSRPTGYAVVWVPFDASGGSTMPTSTALGTTFPYEVVFGGGTDKGWVDGRWSWSVTLADGTVVSDTPRPVGVAISPVDGALYVTSDTGGAIYRVGLAR